VIPKPAQYLLRFDDLCPTMARERWEQFREVLEEFSIRPILAVIPDNRDPSLERAPYDPAFWGEMRALEAAGAAIAVHGYRHTYFNSGKSLLGIHRHSEFASVGLQMQREWIRRGLAILREHGLNPRLWVAPRHGFDRNTLHALHEEGIDYISDGFARIPFRRHAVTWIPQQLWAPVAKTKGLWTTCIHPMTASAADVDRLRSFLKAHWPQFTLFDRVIGEFDGQNLGIGERLYERLALWCVQRRQRAGRKEVAVIDDARFP
jgi:predicted deacetylase